MINYPFTEPVRKITLDREGIADVLRAYEDEWAAAHGERITTAEFYDRYLAGEIDSLFAMAWASYYEVLRESSGEAAAIARELVAI